MRGIIMAGGIGTRMYPVTCTVSKALLPVYDRPMIYLPLATLMELDVREIAVVTNERDHEDFLGLLGDGSQFGVRITLIVQKKPLGIADAFNLTRDFIGDEDIVLILGDNLIYDETGKLASIPGSFSCSATIVGCPTSEPERFGVISFDDRMSVVSLDEKPAKPKSQWAAIGLYFYGPSVKGDVSHLCPSRNGELEITDLNNIYLGRGELRAVALEGIVWMDMGTPESLHSASQFIRDTELRTGRKILCPEVTALNKGWIDKESLLKRMESRSGSDFCVSIIKLLKSPHTT